jgi:pyruvate carboxylase
MWGGATFDTALRFLWEDPWERSAQLRARIPNICFQMLLRGSNAVGYSNYPDNVVAGFVRTPPPRASTSSASSIRSITCPTSGWPWRPCTGTHAIAEAAICYTGDILDPKRDKYPLRYYVKLAKEVARMGAHILAIKDMAGLLRPYAAGKLIKALREEIDLPIHLHTHDSSGINARTVLRAADAGLEHRRRRASRP